MSAPIGHMPLFILFSSVLLLESFKRVGCGWDVSDSKKRELPQNHSYFHFISLNVIHFLAEVKANVINILITVFSGSILTKKKKVINVASS